ncbi:MAG: circularly permuted type 2 ATP-grasp protein [Candidatus Dormibacteria bacterium]
MSVQHGSPVEVPAARLADEYLAGERWFKEQGVNFGLVRDGRVVQRPIPFDPIPRRIGRDEWATLERGLIQRVLALDAFVRDIFDGQRILRAGRIPCSVIYSSPAFLRYASGQSARRPGQVCVAGVDLVQVRGQWLVLEDNVRVPSGIAYALAARRAMLGISREETTAFGPRQVGDYPRRLRAALAGRAAGEGIPVVLTPGPYNAAYYEHRELARQMDCRLVLSHELVASHRGAWLQEGRHRHPISTIYHRYSPEYLDPVGGSPESLIGIPALLAAWRGGHVGLANAPTCGIADDKSLFPYVPEMIRYYLGEPPLLEQPPTLVLTNRDHATRALQAFDAYVFKPVDGSGGKGIVFGPTATDEDRAAVAIAALSRPTSLVAQPMLEIDRLPCVGADGAIEHRRCDLRPFVVMGDEPWVVPGGLTRVAPEHDSFLVNSSAGGGVKDTWVEA